VFMIGMGAVARHTQSVQRGDSQGAGEVAVTATPGTALV